MERKQEAPHHAAAHFQRSQPRYAGGYTGRCPRRPRKKQPKLKVALLIAVALLCVVAALFVAMTLLVATNPTAASGADAGGAGGPSRGSFITGSEAKPPKNISARNVLLVDTESNEAIFEKASTERIAPASTAKMATALTVLDILSPDEEITAGSEVQLIDEEASRAWLFEGDTLTTRQLLTALLLPSGNDAAYILATHAGRAASNNNGLADQQAVDAFMERVNAKAADLGAQDSHFVTPDGADANGQYTTAADLAILARACLNNPTIAKIVGTYESLELWPNGRKSTFYNTNELVNPNSPYYLPGALGVKTGSSEQAGSCLVSAARKNGCTYICVVMGSTDDARFQDSLDLYADIP